jgi:thiol-disulfide isomerase/thioredoxin
LKRGVIVALVVGMAAALGFFLQQRQSQEQMTAVPASAPASTDTAPATDSADATTAASTPAADARPALVVPKTLPQFELADRDNRKRKLGEWKGQPVMVNYWASWCVPCRREIPLLNELRAERKAMKLEIVGIAVDVREDVLEYVKTNPLSYPLLIGEEDGLEAVTAMGVQPAFPFTVFADSQQRILTLKFGELHRDEADMILDRLAKVDAGTLPLEDARTQIEAQMKALATKRGGGKPAAG